MTYIKEEGLIARMRMRIKGRKGCLGEGGAPEMGRGPLNKGYWEWKEGSGDQDCAGKYVIALILRQEHTLRIMSTIPTGLIRKQQ